MQQTRCLFDDIKKSIKKNEGIKDKDELIQRTREDVLEEVSLYPGFPNYDLIVNLSGQRYERSACTSNMAFITHKQQINLDIKYKYPVKLDENNLRKIRKLLESVDTSHCLVFSCEDHSCEAIGACEYSYISAQPVPIIKLTGHMLWKAFIGNYPLFEYKNGRCGTIEEVFNHSCFQRKFRSVFNSTFDSYISANVESYIDGMKKLVEIVSKLGHGTSIVIIEEKKYEKELKRLCSRNTGHGFVLEESIDFIPNEHMLQDDFEKILKDYLAQITKIDGGLLIDSTGKCKAIGCIFDGVIEKGFEGDSGRGSRFNSIKLYIYWQRAQGVKCMGVVVSDDGNVDCI